MRHVWLNKMILLLCIAPQHITTHCNTLQHTTTHCKGMRCILVEQDESTYSEVKIAFIIAQKEKMY